MVHGLTAHAKATHADRSCILRRPRQLNSPTGPRSVGQRALSAALPTECDAQTEPVVAGQCSVPAIGRSVFLIPAYVFETLALETPEPSVSDPSLCLRNLDPSDARALTRPASKRAFMQRRDGCWTTSHRLRTASTSPSTIFVTADYHRFASKAKPGSHFGFPYRFARANRAMEPTS